MVSLSLLTCAIEQMGCRSSSNNIDVGKFLADRSGAKKENQDLLEKLPHLKEMLVEKDDLLKSSFQVLTFLDSWKK
jgi:hypothetical protein